MFFVGHMAPNLPEHGGLDVLEMWRFRALKVTRVELFLGILLLALAWSVVLGFITGVPAILAIVVGVLGEYHLKTVADVRENTCCCRGPDALQHMRRCHIAMMVLSAVGTSFSVWMASKHRDNGASNWYYYGAVCSAVVSLTMVFTAVRGMQLMRGVIQLAEEAPQIGGMHHVPTMQMHNPHHDASGGGYGPGMVVVGQPVDGTTAPTPPPQAYPPGSGTYPGQQAQQYASAPPQEMTAIPPPPPPAPGASYGAPPPAQSTAAGGYPPPQYTQPQHPSPSNSAPPAAAPLPQDTYAATRGAVPVPSSPQKDGTPDHRV